MLCSNCSCVVRPIVAIDIDGTLGDYHGHFLNFACGYFGVEPSEAMFTSYRGLGSFGAWFCKFFSTDMTTFRNIKLAYRQGAQKRTMPYDREGPGVIASIRQRAEVWLTTTRPYMRLDNVDPDTRFWLEKHGIKYDGMLYDDDKYEQLASVVEPGRVVAVLDDEDEQCDAAAEAFGVQVPILKGNLYNDGVEPRPDRLIAPSLFAALQIIDNRLDRWDQTYA